jgi:signal transduction histidine kinase
MPSTVGTEPDLAAIIQAYNDVTERLKRSHEALAREVCRLREELQSKNKELQRRERLASLGEMAAGVAHEIRNPLGGIGLYASLLERDVTDRPKQLALVRKMSAGVSNLECIVGDILAFAGDAEPDPQPVSAGKILQHALEQIAPKAETRDIAIEIDPRLLSVELFCDAAQITRATVNLILNALEAIEGSGRVWIRRDDRDVDKGLLRIAVEDTGRGIAPELLNRIFDPFFTRKDTGTGLGLAIVHRIAEANGGSVSAGNRTGRGAAFVLSVPLAGYGHETDVVGEHE